MQRWICALLLVLPVAASAAAPVGGFLRGGLSLTSFHEEDSFDNEIDLEGGGGLNLSGGMRFAPGVTLKGMYTSTEHDEGEYDFPGIGAGRFEEDSEIEEFRAGVYYEPPFERTVGFRAGVGLESLRIDIPALTFELDFEGIYGEGAVLVRAGRIVTFDVGLALFGLEDNFDQDAGGAEFHAGALFKAGPMDIEVMYRGLNINTEYEAPGGGDVDDTFGELRVSFGASWGYPE